MMDEREQTQRQGKPASYDRANTGAGAKLACWFGVPTLKRLSDEDASALADILRIIVTQSYDDGFRAGCDVMSVYTHDQRLLDGGWPTNH
jgi:hypothetical protein